MEKPPSPKDQVMTESTNRTSATGTPRQTPTSAYGQRRMETMESAFDEHIHQPLENFCPEHILDRLIEDLNTLGEIQPESDGLLSFNDFCRIYGLVQRYSHSSLYPQLRRLIDDRRRALRRQDEATYKEIQSEILEMEEQIVREVSDEIYANLDITADVWQSSW